MSNPAREHSRRKKAKNEQRIKNDYVPLVLWVKDPPIGTYNYIVDHLSELPGIHAASTNIPFKSLDVSSDEISRVLGTQEHEPEHE